MRFEIVGTIAQIATIAEGRGVRERHRLRRRYGGRRWRKMKGLALVRRRDGTFRRAEVHWYEPHGVGRKEIKRKAYVD